MTAPNLFAAIPADLTRELTETLLSSPSVRIERIVSRGHRSPDDFWYEQAEDEWVAVLQGRARLRFADETSERELQPGDHLLIPAGKRHRVAWTDPAADTIWLAVFLSDPTRTWSTAVSSSD